MVSTGMESGCQSDGIQVYQNLRVSIFSCMAMLVIALGLGGSRFAHAIPISDIHEQVGYLQLKSALGQDLPTGNGVPISQVEASNVSPSNPPVYFPDASYSGFSAASDPFSEPTTLIDASGGAGNGTSGHSTY